jgi:hypothetical protein
MTIPFYDGIEYACWYLGAAEAHMHAPEIWPCQMENLARHIEGRDGTRLNIARMLLRQETT